MATGENIFKRKDGRWEARYIKGYDLAGKIIYGFCYGKNYREAKEKVTKCRAELLSERPSHSSPGHAFAWFCDEWLRSCQRTVKPATYIKYSSVMELHVKPGLGGCRPSELTAAAVEDFSCTLADTKGLSPKSMKDILVILRSVLKYAQKRFPGTFSQVEIEYPKEARKEMRVLSRQEQRVLTDYLLRDIDPCSFGILLALYTGMRIGELCALRWENISLEESSIRITQTMQRLKDIEQADGARTSVLIDTPKSERSVREIPLTEEISALCRRMMPSDRTAYVLTAAQNYMEPRRLQYRFARCTEACGLEGVHFHTLRHTFATRCVEVGFEIKTLSEILGHSTTTITLERYVHSSMELKRSNMKKLSAVAF